jgi:hypothetical protein
MVDASAPGTVLLSMPEIAELAGVRRPVVTTWRRRHADFPAPVAGDGGRPLFDAHSIVGWLSGSGRGERRELEADLALHLLGWLGAKLPARHLVAATTALICLRHLDGEPLIEPGGAPASLERLVDRAAAVDPQDRLVRSEVSALSGDMAWLAAAVDDLVEAAWGCRQALERVLASRDRLRLADLYADAISPELAQLAAGLSGARERADQDSTVRIVDPAVGAGDLLVAVLGRLTEDAEPMFAGVASETFLGRIARRRLAVHGIPSPNVEIDTGDGAGEPGGVFDVLVTNLPYVPKEDRPRTDALAPISRIAKRLVARSTAVIIGPADALVGVLPPSHPAAVTRAGLLSGGVVEAVVRLPGGLVPFRPGYQSALWVLRREDRSPRRGRVLLADVSGCELTAGLVDDLITDVVTWRRTGFRTGDHARSVAVEVDVATLLAPEAQLAASRPTGIHAAITGATETIARVNDLEATLGRLAVAHKTSIHSGVAARVPPARVSTARLGALVTAGRLRVLSGTRLDASDLAPAGSRRVLGPPEIVGSTPAGARTVDHIEWSVRHPQAALTEPGDVIVTLSPRLGVYIDELGFSVVEFPARALRIVDDGRELTPRVLAALVSASGASRRAPGAVRSAARLDEIEILQLTPETARRLDSLLTVADERRQLAQREMDAVDELCRKAVDGLADGTLTLG